MSGVRESGCCFLAEAVLSRTVSDTGSFVMVPGLLEFSEIHSIYSVVGN